MGGQAIGWVHELIGRQVGGQALRQLVSGVIVRMLASIACALVYFCCYINCSWRR